MPYSLLTAMPVVPLSRSFRSRHGAPAIDRVDLAIFSKRYFEHCMACTFCNDRCCQFGCDVNAVEAARFALHAPALETFTGKPRERWLDDEWADVPEYPGGRATRTRTEDGLCVFVNRSGRGCMVHGYALASNVDYHDIKPMVCILFPLAFDDGLLHASEEVDDPKDLPCTGAGSTVYRGARAEVAYYFGDECVREIDAIEASVKNGS